ncbi:MAG: hypothetical protein V4577_24350 [Bacteroidota bacterium]
MITRAFFSSLLVLFFCFFCTITAFAQVNWTGAASSDWSNGANWSGGNVPAVTDNVQIGAIAFTNQPTVNADAQIRSLTFAGPTPITLTIPAGKSLSVSTKIVQSHSIDQLTPGTTITGQGTLTCAGVVVGNLASARFVQTKTTTLIAQIDSFKVNGNIDLNSVTANLLTGGVANNNSLFSLQSGGVTVTGKINTYNLLPANCNDFGGNNPKAKFSVDINSDKDALLRTLDTATLNFARTIDAAADFYNPVSGTGRSKIEYAGAGQLVYTNTIDGIDQSPTTYQDLIISGSGNKTAGHTDAGNQLNINGNLTVNNATLDLKTHNPQTTVNGNVTNNGTVNYGTSQTTINGTLFFTSGTFNIGSGEIHFTGMIP